MDPDLIFYFDGSGWLKSSYEQSLLKKVIDVLSKLCLNYFRSSSIGAEFTSYIIVSLSLHQINFKKSRSETGSKYVNKYGVRPLE